MVSMEVVAPSMAEVLSAAAPRMADRSVAAVEVATEEEARSAAGMVAGIAASEGVIEAGAEDTVAAGDVAGEADGAATGDIPAGVGDWDSAGIRGGMDIRAITDMRRTTPITRGMGTLRRTTATIAVPTTTMTTTKTSHLHRHADIIASVRM